MPDLEKSFEVIRSDSDFLKSAGIMPCLLDDPSPKPTLPAPEKIAIPSLTAKDKKWLKACGVAWELGPVS
jgi:hypothetical protein